MVRKRTRARELALKALYQHELRGGLPSEAFAASEGPGENAEVRAFGRELADDRNILRLATYELLFRLDTPPKVAINEAIELAKKFSTENSATFVNGVLDRIYSTYRGKPAGDAQDGLKGSEQRRACGKLNFDDLPDDPQARADLHVHSCASDGSLEPEEVLAAASRANLAAIALADHDTVDGVVKALPAAATAGVRLIPAVELTAYAGPGPEGYELEIHLQGLFVDPWNEGFLAELERLRRVRVARLERISERLRELGFDLSSQQVLRRASGQSVGRLHIAQEMVEHGFCSDIREAFDRYLGVGSPAYVPKERLTPAQAIELVHRAGGCAVLCHPGIIQGVEEALPLLIEAGLDAVEVYNPGHTKAQRCRWREIASRADLAISGGSDFHGKAKPEIEIGQECVSLREVRELFARARARAKAAAEGPRA